MREFRGKRVDGIHIINEDSTLGPIPFVYGSKIVTKNKTYIANQFIGDLEHQDGDVYLIDGISEVIPETVGQYTGKKDKDGVKAYEGDEVKEDYTGIVYEIGWDDHNAGFSLRRKDGEGIKRDDGYEYCGWLYGLSGAFKIIGNIHEHRNSLDNEKG